MEKIPINDLENYKRTDKSTVRSTFEKDNLLYIGKVPKMQHVNIRNEEAEGVVLIWDDWNFFVSANEIYVKRY